MHYWVTKISHMLPHYREEQEKLNVWVGYLNLETLYGTPESVRAVLTRATQHCDALAINLQMVNIYITAGKIEV